MDKTIVMSLGGSVIVPNKINVKFLKNFKKTVLKYTKRNYRFVIYCGGGKIAREYQKAASQLTNLDNKMLDWIGIHSTILNAQFVKIIFGRLAEESIVKDPTKKIRFNKKILIAGGWKPGWSTDFDTVLLAKNLKVKTIINMSNIEYVYDKDPKKNKNAKKIKNISWKQYRKISGSRWKAGMNRPFDPIAAKKAQELGIIALIIGSNLKNFENLLENKKFNGTIIK